MSQTTAEVRTKSPDVLLPHGIQGQEHATRCALFRPEWVRMQYLCDGWLPNRAALSFGSVFLLQVFPGRATRCRKRGHRYGRRNGTVGGFYRWEGKTLFSMSEPDNDEAERDSDDRASLTDSDVNRERGEFSENARKIREGRGRTRSAVVVRALDRAKYMAKLSTMAALRWVRRRWSRWRSVYR